MQSVTSNGVKNELQTISDYKQIIVDGSTYIKCKENDPTFRVALIMTSRDGLSWTSLGVVYYDYATSQLQIEWLLPSGIDITITRISSYCTQITNRGTYEIRVTLLNSKDFYLSDTQ